MDKNKNFIKEINYVSKETIHKENVSTERKYELKNLKNEYTFSPYTCKYFLINSLSFHRKAYKNNS